MRYTRIYISMITTNQHEWIILNVVDSRRKKKWKGGMQKQAEKEFEAQQDVVESAEGI